MQGMTFLITQMLLCLIIAALIGALIGWVLRGSKIASLNARIDALEADNYQSKEDYESLSMRYRDDIDEKDRAISEYRSKLTLLESQAAERDAELTRINTDFTTRISELEEEIDRINYIRDDLKVKDTTIERLESEVRRLQDVSSEIAKKANLSAEEAAKFSQGASSRKGGKWYDILRNPKGGHTLDSEVTESDTPSWAKEFKSKLAASVAGATAAKSVSNKSEDASSDKQTPDEQQWAEVAKEKANEETPKKAEESAKSSSKNASEVKQSTDDGTTAKHAEKDDHKSSAKHSESSASTESKESSAASKATSSSHTTSDASATSASSKDDSKAHDEKQAKTASDASQQSSSTAKPKDTTDHKKDEDSSASTNASTAAGLAAGATAAGVAATQSKSSSDATRSTADSASDSQAKTSQETTVKAADSKPQEKPKEVSGKSTKKELTDADRERVRQIRESRGVRIDTVLFDSHPGVEDDLKEIYGIGPVMEGILNDLGIYSYAQLASLDENQLEVLRESIGTFRNRVDRDDWMSGARKCYQEKYGKPLA